MHNEAVLERQVNRLTASRPGLVVLDLSGLTFLASMAVGQFVMLARSLKGWGGSVRVATPSNDVRLVLERCRLSDTLPVFPSIDAALA
ncbi:MAG: STAS domain-containing protein [Phycisphaerae bacterium]|nr:STAS domain-containing protein [Phycisphaerae bacterium]